MYSVCVAPTLIYARDNKIYLTLFDMGVNLEPSKGAAEKLVL